LSGGIIASVLPRHPHAGIPYCLAACVFETPTTAPDTRQFSPVTEAAGAEGPEDRKTVTKGTYFACIPGKEA
jgi:hypothetical protein